MTQHDDSPVDQLLAAHADRWSAGTSPAQYMASLAGFDGRLRQTGWAKEHLGDLCGVAAMHPDPWVRHAMLRHLATVAPQSPDVQEMVVWLTHDPEDFIVFEAVRQVGRLRIASALPDLYLIVGRASERVGNKPGKPVGLGHAIVLDALSRVVGSNDPADLAKVESELFSGTKELPDELEAVDVIAETGSDLGRGHDHSGMVYVPPGTVSVEVPDAMKPSGLLFDWSDVSAGRRVAVDGFWIDRFQVTAAEYDTFATSEAAREHRRCHPQEAPDKLHVRNTVLDDRFGPDHPATGVDWFDAHSYAAAVGKRLPTEWEWQRAAQGDTGWAYPWGNDFERAPVRWLGEVLGRRFRNVEDWRQALLEVALDTSSPLTVPVDIPSNMSPFGVVGLSGNAWEWTLSNFVSGTAVPPEVGARDLIDLAYDWRSYVGIRGGAWSSMPELTSAAFRGKDLLTDRHYEIGFRCVCTCPPR